MMQRYLLDMLGLGPLADAMQSPEAQQQVLAMIQGLVTMGATVQRIEQKLDMLLAEHNLGPASYPVQILEPPATPIGTTTIAPPPTTGNGDGR